MAVLEPFSQTKWDWASVGEIILRQFQSEQQGMTPSAPSGSNIVFSIPPDSGTPGRIESAREPESTGLVREVVSGVSEHATQPQIEATTAAAAEKDGDDTIMEEQSAEADSKNEETASTVPPEVAPAPSRKRSTDSAGLPETAEGGRSRSKRIRGRDTITEPAPGSAALRRGWPPSARAGRRGARAGPGS